jgi:hypothetical protein
MSGWREVTDAFPGTARLGDENGLHAEVRSSFSGRGRWDATVWGKTGSQTFQNIRSRDTAVALVEHVIGVLQPEHDAEVARMDAAAAARRAAWEKDRPARQAEERKQAAAVAAAPVVDALKCPECAELFRPGDEGEAVYECSRCGGRSLENRCVDCNIFAAKVAHHSCPHCEAALEETPVLVQAAEVDGQLHEKAENPT